MLNFLYTFYFDARKDPSECFKVLVNGKKTTTVPIIHAGETARGMKVILSSFRYDENIDCSIYYKLEGNDDIIRTTPFNRNKNVFDFYFPTMKEGEYEFEIIVSLGDSVISSGVYKGICDRTIKEQFYKDYTPITSVEQIIATYDKYSALYKEYTEEIGETIEKARKLSEKVNYIENGEEVRIQNENARIEKDKDRDIQVNIIKDWIQNKSQFNGKSAYDIWLETGKVGSKEDFINSLIGRAGTNGKSPKIHEGYWYIGDENTGYKVNNIDVDVIESMINEKLKQIVGAAPNLLNTFEEISNALNNDSNFHDTIVSQINALKDKLPKSENYYDEVEKEFEKINVSLNNKSDINHVHNNIPANSITLDEEHRFVTDELLTKINNSIEDKSVINNIEITSQNKLKITKLDGNFVELSLPKEFTDTYKNHIDKLLEEIKLKSDKTSLDVFYKNISKLSNGDIQLIKNNGVVETIHKDSVSYNDLSDKPNIENIFNDMSDKTVFNNALLDSDGDLELISVNKSSKKIVLPKLTPLLEQINKNKSDISIKANISDLNSLVTNVELNSDGSVSVVKKDGQTYRYNLPEKKPITYEEITEKPTLDNFIKEIVIDDDKLKYTNNKGIQKEVHLPPKFNGNFSDLKGVPSYVLEDKFNEKVSEINQKIAQEDDKVAGKVDEKFSNINDRIGDISSVDIDGFLTDSEFKNKKSLVNFIKFIWKKLNAIELTDTKVKITTDGNKLLSVVLGEIKNSIGVLTKLKTKEKTSIVGAVNEINDKVSVVTNDNLISGTTNDWIVYEKKDGIDTINEAIHYLGELDIRSLSVGDKFTFSFKYAFENLEFGSGASIYLQAPGDKLGFNQMTGTYPINIDSRNKEGFYSQTIDVTSNLKRNDKYGSIYLRIDHAIRGKIKIKELKAEKGDTATPWHYSIDEIVKMKNRAYSGTNENLLDGSSNEWNVLEITDGQNTKRYIRGLGKLSLDNINIGDKITVSCVIEYSGLQYSSSNLTFALRSPGDITNWSNSMHITGSINNQTGLLNFTRTITINSNYLQNKNYNAFEIGLSEVSGGTFKVKKIKFERGEVATPWKLSTNDYIDLEKRIKTLENTVAELVKKAGK